MKLSEQVITLEQAKRLKELGVETSILHHFNGKVRNEAWGDDYYPAFTVAELGVMLPTAYDSMRLHEGWRVYDEDGNDGTGKDEVFKTEAQARGALLIHLLETGVITAEQCNTRIISPPTTSNNETK